MTEEEPDPARLTAASCPLSRSRIVILQCDPLSALRQQVELSATGIPPVWRAASASRSGVVACSGGGAPMCSCDASRQEPDGLTPVTPMICSQARNPGTRRSPRFPHTWTVQLRRQQGEAPWG